MSIPALVPEQDRAPSLASRVVTIHATDVTEGAPAPDSVTFALPCALRVPGDDVILRPGGVRVRLVDGRARVRLPVYGGGAVRVDGSDDWLIKVSPSWGGEYGIRVPAGSGEVSLADLPAVRPLTRREKAYAITGVGVTVTEGTHAGGTAEYRNGQIDFEIQVPSFRPETVYPYIDETADARAQHYEQRVRADLDDRLAEVTTAYEVAVAQGYSGTVSDWLDSLVGPKGDPGDDSTVPGPPNSLSIGTVNTGAPGSDAAASITGKAPSQVLGMTIPRGEQGERGPAGSVKVERPAEGVWDFQPEEMDIRVTDVEGLAARLAALEYDSGWRVLTSWDGSGTRVGSWTFPSGVAPTPGSAGSVRIRRVGRRVEWLFSGCSWTSTAVLFNSVAIPAGFCNGDTEWIAPVAVGLTPADFGMFRRRTWGFYINDANGKTSHTTYGTHFGYETTEPIPTTLPGDPA